MRITDPGFTLLEGAPGVTGASTPAGAPAGALGVDGGGT